jgi:hypothetical protein
MFSNTESVGEIAVCQRFQRSIALSQSNPGLAQPWAPHEICFPTLKVLARSQFANAFSVQLPFRNPTQGCSNPGLEFVNAFGVIESSCPRHAA